jgi:hypothetical protein
MWSFVGIGELPLKQVWEGQGPGMADGILKRLTKPLASLHSPRERRSSD